MSNVLQQVREVADRIIAGGGSPSDVRLAVLEECSVLIGRGGSGTYPNVPACPYCGANGGGGHGGFCPGGSVA